MDRFVERRRVVLLVSADGREGERDEAGEKERLEEQPEGPRRPSFSGLFHGGVHSPKRPSCVRARRISARKRRRRAFMRTAARF